MPRQTQPSQRLTLTGIDHIPPKIPLPEGVTFRVRDIRQEELPDRAFDAVVRQFATSRTGNGFTCGSLKAAKFWAQSTSYAIFFPSQRWDESAMVRL